MKLNEFPYEKVHLLLPLVCSIGSFRLLFTETNLLSTHQTNKQTFFCHTFFTQSISENVMKMSMDNNIMEN